MNYPTNVATLEQPAPSPSSALMLALESRVDNGVTEARFIITDTDNNPVFASDDWYSLRSVTYFLWDDVGRVWVYSGDVGTFFWEQNERGTWEKSTYARSDVPAPAFLKEQRPRWHQR